MTFQPATTTQLMSNLIAGVDGSTLGAVHLTTKEHDMMILTPDQARAVVGPFGRSTSCGYHPAADACPVSDCTGPICARPEITPALFIPADEPDAWPVGENIEVAAQHEYCGSPPASCDDCLGYLVGRVRLGEPVQVGSARAWAPVRPFIAHYRYIHELWMHLVEGDSIDITHPHLDLWPDIAAGMWMFPITERSTR